MSPSVLHTPRTHVPSVYSTHQRIYLSRRLQLFTMPSLPSWLSDLSRRKLHVAASGRDGWRDTLNLRRFVLLKNSITQAEDPQPTAHTSSDAFIFPSNATSAEPSESPGTANSLNLQDAWLESVLETLEDDDDTLEVKVELVEDGDLAFHLDSELDDPFDSWAYDEDEYATHDAPLPFSSVHFLSSPSAVLPSSLHVPLQALLNSPHSHYNQPFVEPRYPEADYDLPLSEDSSDGESDDEDGPLTPYSGSEPSLRERQVEVIEPEIFVDPDSYFLYPSELDLISSPTFFQQC